MPRRQRVSRRVIVADPQFHSEGLAKFINSVMLNGKRATAERIVYDALGRISKSQRREPLEVFDQAMRNASPIIEVKPKRVGGATYQVPVEIRHDRRLALARRWIIRSARQRHGRSMADRLAAELMDASNGMGQAVKRKEDTHKMAESNRAFSHFRY